MRFTEVLNLISRVSQGKVDQRSILYSNIVSNQMLSDSVNRNAVKYLHKYMNLKRFHQYFENNQCSNPLIVGAHNFHSLMSTYRLDVHTHCNSRHSGNCFQWLVISQSCSCYHPTLTTSLSTHQVETMPKQRQNRQGHEPSEFLVNVTMFHQKSISKHSLSEFIGKLDDEFSWPTHCQILAPDRCSPSNF